MESESDLAKELFDKVILPIEKRREEEQKRKEELENLNKTTQSQHVLPELPAQASSESESAPVSSAQETTPVPAPAQETTLTSSESVSKPALPPQAPVSAPASLESVSAPAIKVNKEELLSENNIDNLLTILRKTLSQKQDETENIIEQHDNELVITPSDNNKLIEPVNNNSEVETVVRPQSSVPAPAFAPVSEPAPEIVTSCDDEDCQEPINTSQSQQVSLESQQDISLTPPDLSEEVPITNLTQKIPELNIGDKMSWITQALAVLFSTIGNLFTFEPVQDNDPYVNEEKEKQGYVYVGKMYMKPEDESKRPDKVKYISYNPTEKDFYIDEREEVKE